MAPGRLELEITESALVRDLAGARGVLGSLREAGVRIVLDNFGTGYSSLYHLRNFKLDKIKIDRSFIETLGSHESAGIVRAVVGGGPRIWVQSHQNDVGRDSTPDSCGSPAWIRTTIHGSKGRCPTIRRPGNLEGVTEG